LGLLCGLAADLRALGHIEAARRLDENALARSRDVLGEDHPDTLAAVRGLAADLRALGHADAAQRLDEEALARSHDRPGSNQGG
jgi:Tetratricopeptide repeat